MHSLKITSPWLLLLAMPALVLAEPSDDTDALDDLLSGFEDDSFIVGTPVEQAEAEPGNWQLTTDINFTAVYNYNRSSSPPGRSEFAKLSQLRLRIRPELWFRINDNWDAKISASGFYDAAYQMEGRGDFTQQLLNESESETEFRDTFIRGKLGNNLDIKLGKQIVVWGKSDNLRVVDVLNPLDMREPGQVDIEDLRIPVNMAKLDYYFGNAADSTFGKKWGRWGISAIVIPEIRFDKTPAWGSEFYPSPIMLPPEVIPSDGGSDTEYAMALNGRMKGWDIAFHLARIYDDRFHFAAGDSGFELQHRRLDMAGVAASVATGNWLLKGELAHFDGLEFFATPGDDFSRTDIMFGAEYNGFNNTTLSLESLVRHINDFDSVLKTDPVPVQEDAVQTAFRYNADFLHDRLNVVLLATRFGESLGEGGFTRLQFKYDLKDAVSLTLGTVQYHGGEQTPFEMIKTNDRLFLDLKFSF